MLDPSATTAGSWVIAALVGLLSAFRSPCYVCVVSAQRYDGPIFRADQRNVSPIQIGMSNQLETAADGVLMEMESDC